MIADLCKIGSEFAEHRSALFGKLSEARLWPALACVTQDLLRVHYEKHSQRWLKARSQGVLRLNSMLFLSACHPAS